MKEQPPTAEPQNVVNHVCHTLRLGSSLIHLYNLLLPAFSMPTSTLYSTLPNPQPIPYDFPAFMTAPNGVHEWARQPENAKSCKKYIASFSMAMWKLKKDGRWHESDELWAVHELWGEDTGGLMKVLYTVDLMLDSMPESALLSPASPTTPHPQSAHSHHQSISNHTTGPHDQSSYDIPFSMGGTGPGAGGISTMAANMHADLHTAERDGEASRRASMAGSSSAYRSVEELVASERTYVQELEVLQRYSRELLQYQLVTPDTVHLMFSNLGKVLDFHVRSPLCLCTELTTKSAASSPSLKPSSSPCKRSAPLLGVRAGGGSRLLNLCAISLIRKTLLTLLRRKTLPCTVLIVQTSSTPHRSSLQRWSISRYESPLSPGQ